MQLPSPGESMERHGWTATGPVAIAMPPTPPEMLSRSAGRDGPGGWQPQAHASGEAVGVAWLGVAETTTAPANEAGGAAVAAAGDSGPL